MNMLNDVFRADEPLNLTVHMVGGSTVETQVKRETADTMHAAFDEGKTFWLHMTGKSVLLMPHQILLVEITTNAA
ncbi:hypothetical protein [Natronoglycomyces albus]|uniref:Uncharacterized protein n=1 Tax=Natronoglycomyces albus TaxID=2811108 RepID=A0A895XP49_9ACTN|nr:hypothetical protein [Natronoglycomyces albus]QSB07134.1 hypothetical protein JQS30_16870 [Natronoglycomyces albus]